MKEKNAHEEESAGLRMSPLHSLSLAEKDKHDVFSYEWTSYPSSLFEPDEKHPCGYVTRKGNKADYILAIKDTLVDGWKEEGTLPVSHV